MPRLGKVLAILAVVMPVYYLAEPGLVLRMLLALLSLVVGVAPGWLVDLSQTAGDGLADPSAYVEAVLPR